MKTWLWIALGIGAWYLYSKQQSGQTPAQMQAQITQLQASSAAPLQAQATMPQTSAPPIATTLIPLDEVSM